MKTEKNRLRPTGRAVFCCLVFLLAASLATVSRAANLDTFLADIKEASERVASLRCDFKQTKNLAMFNAPIVFHGSLAVERPDRLRWEFTDPVGSALIFNGRKGIRCTEDQAPAHFDLDSDPVMAMVAQQLWTWLSGDYGRLRDEYGLQLDGDSSLTITPRKAETATIIKAITIDFDTPRYHPSRVVIEEPGGDSTTIEFFDYRIDPQLSRTIFTSCDLE